MNDLPCPRVIYRDKMIAGLRAGRTLCVDRCDAPELPELLELEQQGKVVSLLVEGDQYSVLKFRWRDDAP